MNGNKILGRKAKNEREVRSMRPFRLKHVRCSDVLTEELIQCVFVCAQLCYAVYSTRKHANLLKSHLNDNLVSKDALCSCFLILVPFLCTLSLLIWMEEWRSQERKQKGTITEMRNAHWLYRSLERTFKSWCVVRFHPPPPTPPPHILVNGVGY